MTTILTVVFVLFAAGNLAALVRFRQGPYFLATGTAVIGLLDLHGYIPGYEWLWKIALVTLFAHGVLELLTVVAKRAVKRSQSGE